MLVFTIQFKAYQVHLENTDYKVLKIMLLRQVIFLALPCV